MAVMKSLLTALEPVDETPLNADLQAHIAATRAARAQASR